MNHDATLARGEGATGRIRVGIYTYFETNKGLSEEAPEAIAPENPRQ